MDLPLCRDIERLYVMCSYVKNTNYTCHILQLICQNGGPEVVVNCVRN